MPLAPDLADFARATLTDLAVLMARAHTLRRHAADREPDRARCLALRDEIDRVHAGMAARSAALRRALRAGEEPEPGA